MANPVRGYCYECGQYLELVQGSDHHWYCYQCWSDTMYEIARRKFEQNEVHKTGENPTHGGVRDS